MKIICQECKGDINPNDQRNVCEKDKPPVCHYCIHEHEMILQECEDWGCEPDDIQEEEYEEESRRVTNEYVADTSNMRTLPTFGLPLSSGN